jgi:hypothetical protein
MPLHFLHKYFPPGSVQLTPEPFMNENRWRSHRVFLLVWGLVLCIDIQIVGIHFESSTYIGNALTNGTALGLHLGNFYCRDMVGFGPAIAVLYQYWPHIPWFGLVLLACSLVSAYLLFYKIIHTLQVSKWPFIYQSVFCLSLLLLLNVNLLQLHMTRAAFLLCVAGLFYIARSTGRQSYLAAFCLFTAGTCMRPEAAMGVLAVMVPGLFYIYRNRLRFLIRPLVVTTLPLMALTGLYQYHTHSNTNYYYTLEPDSERQILDRQNVLPVSAMTTSADTARYRFATHWILGDIHNIPASYVRSIIGRAMPRKPSLHQIVVWLSQSSAGAIKALVLHKNGLLISLLMALLLVGSAHVLHTTLLVLFTTFWLWFLLTLLNSLLPEEHIIEALAFTALTTLLLLAKAPGSLSTQPLVSAVMVAAFLFASHHQLRSSLHYSQTQTQIIEQNQRFLAPLQEKEAPYIFIAGSPELFFTKPFSTTPVFRGKQLIITDVGQYSANTEFLKYITTTTGCPPTDYRCRFKWIQARKKKLLIIGNEYVLNLYKNYLWFTYKLSFTYKAIGPLHPNQTDNYYIWE